MDVEACEDKYLLKHGALEEEFEELQADVDEVCYQLQRAKEVKANLQAEVKFLKRRVKMLKGMATSEPAWRTRDLKHTVDKSSQLVMSGGAPATKKLYDGAVHMSSKSHLPHRPIQGAGTIHIGLKNKDVVGVLKKTSSVKGPPKGFAQTKKTGKRKISWQDEFSVQM